MEQKSTIIRKVWTNKSAKLITVPKDCLDINPGDFVFVTKINKK